MEKLTALWDDWTDGTKNDTYDTQMQKKDESPPTVIYTTDSETDESSTLSPRHQTDIQVHAACLEEKCTALQSVIADLDTQRSKQDDLIRYMTAEMIRILDTKQMDEKNLSTEMERYDIAMAKIQSSFQHLRSSTKKDEIQSQQKIAELETCNSSLEDEVEKLRAENVSLRLKAHMIEQEKKNVEDKLETELQLMSIENSNHEIL